MKIIYQGHKPEPTQHELRVMAAAEAKRQRKQKARATK